MLTEIVPILSFLIFEYAQKFYSMILFGKVKTICKDDADGLCNVCFIYYSPYMNCVYSFTYKICPSSFYFFLNDAMNSVKQKSLN